MYPGQNTDILVVIPLAVFIGLLFLVAWTAKKLFGKERGEKITGFILYSLGALGVLLAFIAAFRR